MQISELAKRTGVSAHALRHYEKLGLLQPARRASGYREYTEAMRREVVFIAMSRQIGFSLKDIAEQLPAYRSGRLTVEQMVGAMQTRVQAIDAQIDALRAQRRTVVSHIAWMNKQAAQAASRASAAASKGKPRPPWPKVKTAKPPRQPNPRKTPP